MNIDPTHKIDFCDVLIKPKRSLAVSRANVNLKQKFSCLHSGFSFEAVPIIAANMYNTGTFEMAEALAKFNCLTALHKFYSLEELVDWFVNTESSQFSFYSMGMADLKKANKFVEAIDYRDLPKLICLDVANGYTSTFLDFVSFVRKTLFPESFILAGNVATSEGAQDILRAGASAVKVGIGGGSHCETRNKTGVGYPQLSAIIECSDTIHGFRLQESGYHGLCCSDGGCQETGDICKAFGAGADFVMLGGMLMGCEECAGEMVNIDGKDHLKCFGMSSYEANHKFYDKMDEYKTSEGAVKYHPAKGPVSDTMKDIMGGLRSACTYVGTEDLKHFSKCTTFIRR